MPPKPLAAPILSLSLSLLLLAACQTTTAPPPSQSAPVARLSLAEAEARLAPVQARMEPVAERQCRARAPGVNCDFQISIDPDRSQPPNAYQSQSPSGRPRITFTTALIADARNPDELAFVLGHEAAHHIQGHIARSQGDALSGALLAGVLAVAIGADGSGVDLAMDLGAGIGSRVYSKDYELEADQLGTVITHDAGYDPLIGVAYFTRIPDPGNRFLGTHPPNRDRIARVEATARGL
ncbi:M48 family metallopeptidase [Shimia sp.]|uniref:M48 family metallopeptidase n=1 Tax=Shimia sp. TaxID=1954381 RepID=UPI003561FFD2